MSTPIGNNLQALFEDVRQNAYKRGHLAARLEILRAIEHIATEQRTAKQALTQLLQLLNEIETPAQEPKKETRGRKPKAKSV
jgi:hypothetical protein